MKKIIFLLLFASFLYVPKQVICQTSNVASEISMFNVKENESSLTTLNERKWWQTLLNVFTVVSADVAGVAAGVYGTIALAGYVGLATGGVGVGVVAGIAGVIGGAGASNGAYQGLNRGASSQVNYGNLNIVLPKNYSFYSLIGKQHNEVLHNNFFLGESLSNYYVPLLNEEQIKIIESNEVTEMFDFLKDLGFKYSQNGLDFQYLTNELINKKLMTSVGKEILTVFFEKYRNCASPKDMENLINYSIERVSNSSLDESEKLSLIAAFMVSSESPFYQNPIQQ